MGGLERVKELYLLDTMYWGHKYHLKCWPGLHLSRTKNRGHLRRCRPWVLLDCGGGAMQSTHFSPPKPCGCCRCEMKEQEEAAILLKKMVEVYILYNARNCENG
jgi:hypothetical protein